MKRKLLIILAILAVTCWAGLASATPVTFTGSSGNLAASVSFDIVGGQLQVVLTNTSTFDVLNQAGVLTGVFWSGTSGLTPLSANVSGTPGTITVAGTTFTYPAGQSFPNVGGEFIFGATSGPSGATQGIASSGYISGAANFPVGATPLTQPPPVPDGIDFGITSASDNPSTGTAGGGQGGLLGNPLITDQVTFLLSGLAPGFKLSDIANVSFQYGTSLSEPNVPGTPGGGGTRVPIPPTALLLGSGLLGLGLIGWRKKG